MQWNPRSNHLSILSNIQRKTEADTLVSCATSGTTGRHQLSSVFMLHLGTIRQQEKERQRQAFFAHWVDLKVITVWLRPDRQDRQSRRKERRLQISHINVNLHSQTHTLMLILNEAKMQTACRTRLAGRQTDNLGEPCSYSQTHTKGALERALGG